MATNVIMPALGISQETGRVLKWFKAEGEAVTKGEPLFEVETDKITAEIEAPASGVLTGVTALVGDDVPVGQPIAFILADGERTESVVPISSTSTGSGQSALQMAVTQNALAGETSIVASALLTRMEADQDLNLSVVKPAVSNLQKTDPLADSESQQNVARSDSGPTRALASPKARRLAEQRGVDLTRLKGSGPGAAVLAADVIAAEAFSDSSLGPQTLTLNAIWRRMAERTTESWTSVPHFFLMREVNASRLLTCRSQIQEQATAKITYTDLLIKLIAVALSEHRRLNATWNEGALTLNAEVNIGLAIAVEDGLQVPVIHRADALSLMEIVARRQDLVVRAQAGKLRREDVLGGTFTLSNLGMYGVDAFNAIINPPQVAIVAVGRIVERVVPLQGQPVVQPMMMLNLSCDHRAVDGARAAKFLATFADLIEGPLGLLDDL